MTKPLVSDERIHAFVDDDLGPRERDEMFALCAADPAIERRVAEARRTKALLAHAYDTQPPAARHPRVRARPPIAAAVMAVTLLAAGAGWFARDWWHPGRAPAASGGDALGPGVVIQVADADPVKWQLALDQAHAALAEAGRARFDVVVIAYGPGLPMLDGRSGPVGELARSRAQGIRFLACGNSMERQHMAAARLAPGVEVASEGATMRIVHLQHRGYAYVRI